MESKTVERDEGEKKNMKEEEEAKLRYGFYDFGMELYGSLGFLV